MIGKLQHKQTKEYPLWESPPESNTLFTFGELNQKRLLSDWGLGKNHHRISVISPRNIFSPTFAR